MRLLGHKRFAGRITEQQIRETSAAGVTVIAGDIVRSTNAGGSFTRAQADKRLFECMRKAGKTPVVGKFLIPALYYGAVRSLGWLFYKKKG